MRLIDGDALKHEICNIPMCGEHEQFYAIVSEVVKVLIAAPTIDPARHARWVEKEYEIDSEIKIAVVCSDCEANRTAGLGLAKYCYNCGARMDGEGEKDG